MTRAKAHAILNAAKDGRNVSCRAITAALRATGDIDLNEYTVQALRPVGTWRLVPGFALRRSTVEAMVERVERESALEAA